MVDYNEVLSYKVHKCSSYSANYVPDNVLVNKPNRQSSRWSSGTNYPPQFLVLKLTEPAVVSSITFGKYEKTHVCNLKKFEIHGGMEENNLILLLQGGLKNDNIPETFSLKHKIDGKEFPCTFIKIVPILSWGASFNFSIWFIEVQGSNNAELVQSCLQWYFKYREREVVRLCLKHFRQHNYMGAFESLQKKTKILLEDPLLSNLHQVLVCGSDFESTESVIENAIKDGMFSSYIGRQVYKPKWTSIVTKRRDGCGEHPGMRGGHQMCADHINNILYLLGGWNGVEDLADFWQYCVRSGVWTCISRNTASDGGPSARSCHKMCIDSKNGKIYTLGRYLDSIKRNHQSVENDFHVYDITQGAWSLISKNVSAAGGPKLIFDHQMCYDERTHTIFVFGGRILTCATTLHGAGLGPTHDERPIPEFSGLYSYNVDTNTWRLLREDSGNAGPQDIRSRIGHSMLLDSKNHRLYIFGGQRSKEYVNDFFYYDIDRDQVTVLNDGTRKEPGLPPSGFTQRATINSDLGEIHMLSGLSKDREKREENMHNSFWVYLIQENRWSCIYKNNVPSNNGSSQDIRTHFTISKPTQLCDYEHTKQEPCPRYAHQLVYDNVRQVHYMFGGNPGKTNQPKLRLDDFWSLKLTRPTEDDILRKCRYAIRRQHFRELAVRNPVSALGFLQTRVSDVVDHNDVKEETEFRFLTSSLFGDGDGLDSDDCDETDDTNSTYLYTDSDEARAGRTALFDSLVKYFPDRMTQPRGNLIDLISF
uniref:muskelin-like n=1 Tax=Ciona intestinalis TaxID=7719 RepID=UPI000180C88E|nr:muskelin-like [Ciona intestinalis]|eukprot:XP_002130194.1 muskelin-like [Ciona intestinalis]